MQSTRLSQPGTGQPRDCPDSETWIRFAAGVCPAEEQDSLLAHAAQCEDCASGLRNLVDAVSFEDSGKPDPAIEALSARLEAKSATLSRAMARSNRVSSSRASWMLAAAASLAILAGAAAWFAWTQARNKPPLQLLAKAYTSRRTLELQIPRAQYSPLRTERGPSSLSNLPPELLESQLEIERHLKSKPDDPAWLHAQGRVQLLLWQFDEAIHSFQAAADLGANSPDFLVDYASAYYERAERNSVALDYAQALEKLGAALKQRPDDPAALFNSGIIHAKLHQYDSAIEDFEHALRVQTDASWKQEIQTRLDEAKRLHGALTDPYRNAPAEFLSERDLETAITTELEAFFEGRATKLEQTGAAMLELHQDPWLNEVIKLRPDAGIVRAVRDLSGLARRRVKSNPDYDSLAGEIEWLRAVSLPWPLRVWRDYEILFRDTRSLAVNACADRTQALIDAASRYPWMEAQMLLESSLCSAARQDFAGARVLVDRAEDEVKQNKLFATSIRIPIFRAQRLAETGYFREAVQTAVDVLTRIDGGGYPLRRAYDAHGVIMLVATQLNLLHTGYGASRMMAWIGQTDGIRLFEMIGRCREAGFALALGLDAEAASALQSAESLLAGLSWNPTAKIYWRTSRIAWLESRNDLPSLYRMLEDAHREGGGGKENLYFNRKLIAAICRLEANAQHRVQVEQLAEPFWREASETSMKSAGAAAAFRPELASVSEAISRVRLESGDESGALESWLRFLRLDQKLMGGREESPAADSRGDYAILTLAGLGERVALWFESGGQTRFHWAAESSAGLARRIRELRRLCSLGAPAEEVASQARDLYRILFPEGTGGASQVVIRTRGQVNTLPLSLFQLVKEGAGVEFSFVPFEGATDPMPNPANARMTVVSATNFDGRMGLPAVPEEEVSEEAESARAAFGDTVVIRGAQATARAMEEAAMHSQAVHFTGHAVPWRGNIGLLLSPDESDPSPDGKAGLWTMGRPRSVNADLVILSACSTAAFEDLATVEPGQLALSMLLAGAHRVVASLWDVDSSATAAWNGAFYERIAAGDPPARAMTLASQRVRSMPPWQSPKYWAGFALYQN